MFTLFYHKKSIRKFNSQKKPIFPIEIFKSANAQFTTPTTDYELQNTYVTATLRQLFKSLSRFISKNMATKVCKTIKITQYINSINNLAKISNIKSLTAHFPLVTFSHYHCYTCCTNFHVKVSKNQLHDNDDSCRKINRVPTDINLYQYINL